MIAPAGTRPDAKRFVDVNEIARDNLGYTLDEVELARNLRAIRADIPIVLISGLGEPSRQAAAISEVGLADVLAKPFTLRELGVTVARALSAAVPARSPADRHTWAASVKAPRS